MRWVTCRARPAAPASSTDRIFGQHARGAPRRPGRCSVRGDGGEHAVDVEAGDDVLSVLRPSDQQAMSLPRRWRHVQAVAAKAQTGRSTSARPSPPPACGQSPCLPRSAARSRSTSTPSSLSTPMRWSSPAAGARCCGAAISSVPPAGPRPASAGTTSVTSTGWPPASLLRGLGEQARDRRAGHPSGSSHRLPGSPGSRRPGDRSPRRRDPLRARRDPGTGTTGQDSHVISVASVWA